MDVDIAQTAAAATPYVTAAVTAYGVSTLEKVRETLVDKTSTATVDLGSRLLSRLLRRDESRQVIENAVNDLAAGEREGVAALTLQIRKALAADLPLAREVAAMLPSSSMAAEASGERSIAIGTNSGVATTGDFTNIQW